MPGTLAHGYSYESSHREPSNEYQHGRVWTIIRNIVLWTKVALLALEGLSHVEEISEVFFLVLMSHVHHAEELVEGQNNEERKRLCGL